MRELKKRIEFREQKFKVLATLPVNNVTEWLTVEGLVRQPFGVFKFNHPLAREWSVTHLPSGRRVLAAVSEAAGCKIIERLLATDFNWHKPEFTKAETHQMIELIERKLVPNFVADGWLAPR